MERLDSDPAIPIDEQLDYSALSPEAKAVFEDARQSPDGTVTIYGDDCPEQFTYYDDVATNYAINQNGTAYQLVTRGSGDGALPWVLALSWAVAISGVAVAIVGARSAIDGHIAVPAFYAGLGALTVGVVAFVGGLPAGLCVVFAFVTACLGMGAVSTWRSALATGVLLVPAAGGWFLVIDGGIGPHMSFRLRFTVGLLLVVPLLVMIGTETKTALKDR